jgi:chorismate synthase
MALMAGIRWLTAGESHGPGVLAVVEGVPSGLSLDLGVIEVQLRRRQGGHGRGRRMSIEEDRVRVLAGLKRGVTLGSPIALLVPNQDDRIDRYRSWSRPRPGHADLAGALKYGTRDCADIMERASARETAARVAAGSVAQQALGALGVEVFAWVTRIGEVALETRTSEERHAVRDRSPFYSLDPEGDPRAVAWVDRMLAEGDTAGGRFAVEARGVPPGLGSHVQWDRRLDGRLAGALMAIQGMKAVEIGAGVSSAEARGSAFQDPILPGGRRPTNRAGGIEGGISNGQPVCVQVTMKPIPSLPRPLPSVDLETGEACEAVYERSDTCAVPAASVVGEAVTALVLLDALLEKTGGDSLPEVRDALGRFQRFPGWAAPA